eukprot:3255533-Amphidinium_carterae.1
MPLLSLCADQASQQLAPCNFLMHKSGLSLTVLADPNHRISNDLLNAVRQSSFSRVLRRKCVPFNVFFGPWGSGGFHTKTIDAMEEVMKLASAQDP